MAGLILMFKLVLSLNILSPPPFWTKRAETKSSCMSILLEKLSRPETPPNSLAISTKSPTSLAPSTITSALTTSNTMVIMLVNVFSFVKNNLFLAPYADWLNTDAVKKAYGVDPSVTFKDCVDQTYTDFYPDIGTSYAGNYSYLLSQNIIPDLKVILYSGQNDIICNTVGTYNYITTLDWTGVDGFVNSKKQILKVANGTVAGNYKVYEDLTFAVIYDAGHMVPMDQPDSAKTMLDMFIQGKFKSERTTVTIDM